MLKYAVSFLLCISTNPTAAFDHDKTVAGTIGPNLVSPQQPAHWADGQTVTNNVILGPTQELLPPIVATRTLHGDDYVEWCLRWNKLQYFLAAKRAVAPRTVNGSVTTRHSYSKGVTHSSYWRPVSVGSTNHSTSRTREEVWQIGGYGGGPVTIYNPFVIR